MCDFCLYLLFFFFQAEDGIRDGHVTGVQTCALPISHAVEDPDGPPAVEGLDSPPAGEDPDSPQEMESRDGSRPVEDERSEERRVGKGGRSRGAAEQENKKRRQETRDREKE